MVEKVVWQIDPVDGKELSEYPEYEGRVQYSAHIHHNCKLTLRDVETSDSKVYYVRIIAKNQSHEATGVQVHVSSESSLFITLYNSVSGESSLFIMLHNSFCL